MKRPEVPTQEPRHSMTLIKFGVSLTAILCVAQSGLMLTWRHTQNGTEERPFIMATLLTGIFV